MIKVDYSSGRKLCFKKLSSYFSCRTIYKEMKVCHQQYVSLAHHLDILIKIIIFKINLCN
jgi:hypothetical protein